MKHVIIGAGAAGVRAAKTIKKIDASAEVVIFGEEGFFPYNRYKLTDFLCDEISEADMFYASADYFREIGVRLRKGQFVKAIDPGKKTVKLFHNEVVSYDKLLIATGGTPRLGPVLQPYEKLIHRYYSLKDILLLKKKLPHINTCIVSGQGLSSLDLLCGLCRLEKRITYIMKGRRADWSLVDTELYDDLIELMKKKKVEIISEDRITSIEKTDAQFRVSTLKQRQLSADIVFAWDDYMPNISFIKGTGIEKKLGILVNEQMETSVEDIYAAGDCVEIYHRNLKNYRINFGWPTALEQGEIAGKSMTGQKGTYKFQESLDFELMGKSIRARWWK